MAEHLDEYGLSYKHLFGQYNIIKSDEEYKKWLKSVGIKHKAWHNKIVDHFIKGSEAV